MRIKIENIGTHVLTYFDQVRINDLNYGNHVGHQVIYEYCHDARLAFFANLQEKIQIPVSEMAFGNYGLIMGHSGANYVGEITYGMSLEILVYLNDIGSSRFELNYLIKDHKTGHSLARVATGMVCFDYQNKKIVPLPEKIRYQLETLTQPA